MSIPALAEEVSGTIKAIDQASATLTLDDGSTYALPGEFDYTAVKPGMEVVVIFDETDATHPVIDLQPEQ
nr:MULTISPECIES: DUF1344 domain-containing protein [unclassified Aurantimonas]